MQSLISYSTKDKRVTVHKDLDGFTCLARIDIWRFKMTIKNQTIHLTWVPDGVPVMDFVLDGDIDLWGNESVEMLTRLLTGVRKDMLDYLNRGKDEAIN
nr:MAG TPA: hypothetical protein [Caudoviricetes sp.]